MGLGLGALSSGGSRQAPGRAEIKAGKAELATAPALLRRDRERLIRSEMLEQWNGWTLDTQRERQLSRLSASPEKIDREERENASVCV